MMKGHTMKMSSTEPDREKALFTSCSKKWLARCFAVLTGCAVALMLGGSSAVVGLTPSDAAVYLAQREGLSVRIVTEGRRVERVQVRYPYRCSDGKRHQAGLLLTDSTAVTNLSNGRFVWKAFIREDGFTSKRRVQGRVGSSRVFGSLSDVQFRSGSWGRLHCWTGRSRTSTSVKFIATRQLAPSSGRR
jgi:hypothetical protein